jgi:hypothetical protein
MGRPPNSKTGTAIERIGLRVTPHRKSHWLEHGGPNLSGWLTELADKATNYKEVDNA